jgi:hypothetical protein
MPQNPSDELLARRRARRDAGIGQVTSVNIPQTVAELGGDCLCGRGPALGTCVVSASRLLFRSFQELPAAYHLEHVTDWACVDCIADAALDVANGVVRERMRESARQRGEEMDALVRRNEMRKEAGLPLEWIDPGGNEWPVGSGQ